MIKYLLVFILLSTPCLAGMGIGGFPQPGPGVLATSVGGSCSTQSVLLNQIDNATTNFNDTYDTSSHVLKITGNGKKLYSVKYKTSARAQGAASSWDINVSTALSFSSPVDSFTITTPGTTDTEFTGLSSSQPTLSNGTDYYIALNKNDNSWGTRLSVVGIGGNLSTPTNNGWWASSLNGAYVQFTSYAMWAEVKVCDN